MANGIPTAYRRVASDARGSRLIQRVRRLRSGEQSPGSTGTSRKPELHVLPTTCGTLGRPVIGHRYEKPLSRGFSVLVRTFRLTYPLCPPRNTLVTLLF